MQNRLTGSVRRLLTFRLLLILVPMLLVQTGIYYRGYRAQRRMALQMNLEAARSIAATFDAYVRETLRDEVVVGENFVLPPVATREQENQVLARTVQEYPPIQSFSWVTSEGRVYSSSAPTEIGVDYSRTPWFRRLASGKAATAVSDAVRRPGRTTFIIAQSIRSPEGQWAGVVTVAIDPAKLGSYLLFSVPPGATFTLIDASGWVVYRYPRMDLPWNSRNWGERSALVRDALHGKGQSAVASSLGDNASRYIGVTPIPPIGWAVGVGRPSMLVTSGIKRELLADSWAVFVVALLAFGLATASARQITKPLLHLRGHALAMGRGQLDSRVEEMTGPAELVDLATVFNQMADRLELREHEHERLLEVERERARSGRLLETVTEHTLTALAYLDRDLHYLRVNSAYCQATGYAPEELVGRTYVETLNTPEVLAMLQRAREAGEPVEVTDMWHRPMERSGRGPSYWDVTVAPVKDEQGAVEGLVLSAIDVTARVEAREQMLESARARARMAETIAAEINHRMKNNLMLISGLMGMQLAAQTPDSPAAEALQEAITRMSALSVVHEQMYEGHSGNIELKDAMERMGRLAASALSRGDAVLTITGEPTYVPPKVGSAISMVANELITNAIKHAAPAPDGEVRIDISVSRQGNQLRVGVWNSGEGLPDGFDISQQRGMGLRLVRGVVQDQFGGTFSLRSAGGGTLGEILLEVEEVPGGEENEGSEGVGPASRAVM